MEKKRSGWWYLLLGLGFTPCLFCCAGMGLLTALHVRDVSEQRKVGDMFIASLEAEHARSGAYPQKPAVPPQFTYEAYEDGGYLVFFPEHGLLGPSDMFSVWDAHAHAWETKPDMDLRP